MSHEFQCIAHNVLCIMTIFKYNAQAKYSAKDLKGEHNSNNFSLLDVSLDEEEPSVKIQISLRIKTKYQISNMKKPNIFKDHHFVAKPSPTTVGYDEWPLSIALWIKF